MRSPRRSIVASRRFCPRVPSDHGRLYTARARVYSSRGTWGGVTRNSLCSSGWVAAARSRRSSKTSARDALKTRGSIRSNARTDIPRLRSMLIDQVTEASGGPATYTGRDMKPAHAEMGVTSAEFSALVEDLVATLNKFGVGKAEQDELLGILGPLKSDIVEVDSTATGTPLPDSYDAAPALTTAKS
ncbi:MAG TPA: group 1 truncated hemoglobin [Candidatus Udaeobacter sp.]|nr:group 1 truncated hemoglobin [Candidatus Udaeobacter sp.]